MASIYTSLRRLVEAYKLTQNPNISIQERADAYLEKYRMESITYVKNSKKYIKPGFVKNVQGVQDGYTFTVDNKKYFYSGELFYLHRLYLVEIYIQDKTTYVVHQIGSEREILTIDNNIFEI